MWMGSLGKIQSDYIIMRELYLKKFSVFFADFVKNMYNS